MASRDRAAADPSRRLGKPQRAREAPTARASSSPRLYAGCRIQGLERPATHERRRADSRPPPNPWCLSAGMIASSGAVLRPHGTSIPSARGERVLGREDPDVSEAIARRLHEEHASADDVTLVPATTRGWDERSTGNSGGTQARCRRDDPSRRAARSAPRAELEAAGIAMAETTASSREKHAPSNPHCTRRRRFDAFNDHVAVQQGEVAAPIRRRRAPFRQLARAARDLATHHSRASDERAERVKKGEVDVVLTPDHAGRADGANDGFVKRSPRGRWAHLGVQSSATRDHAHHER